LVGNAIKFTSEGAVTVRLNVAGSGETRRFVLEVADTGVGFDPDDVERLFRRFEQADSSITRRFGGTGLGLAICRQLADLMGGTIRADGRPGRGASFTVELPLPRAEPMADATEDFELSLPPAMRILVAEDNPTNRKVAELMLGAMGAEVRCVENGAEAVQAVREGGYDLVFMDLQMPVIVLSANVMPEHLAASKAAGADGHLGKPIRSEELMAALNGAVRPQELKRAG
ncbi:MAG: ATP-binding protein, partial [Caulobacteraceae bacterium]